MPCAKSCEIHQLKDSLESVVSEIMRGVEWWNPGEIMPVPIQFLSGVQVTYYRRMVGVEGARNYGSTRQLRVFCSLPPDRVISEKK